MQGHGGHEAAPAQPEAVHPESYEMVERSEFGSDGPKSEGFRAFFWASCRPLEGKGTSSALLRGKRHVWRTLSD